MLSTAWLQAIAEKNNVSAVPPSVARTLATHIEQEVKYLLQHARKITRQRKKKCVTIQDINLVLSQNKLEKIYGLSHPSHIIESEDGDKKIAIRDTSVNLIDFARSALPFCPLQSEVSFHWYHYNFSISFLRIIYYRLAVHGKQPRIPENPTVIVQDNAVDSSELPKELQLYYTHITSLLLSNNIATLPQIQTDAAISLLLPYFCRFIYFYAKHHSHNLTTLYNLNLLIKELLHNNFITLDSHLGQILPALFTSVLGSHSAARDNTDVMLHAFDLRSLACFNIMSVAARYGSQITDLLPRICKTYTDPLDAAKLPSLPVIYGIVTGLGLLGINVISTVLLPRLNDIYEILQQAEQNSNKSKQQLKHLEYVHHSLQHTLGRYMNDIITSAGANKHNVGRKLRRRVCRYVDDYAEQMMVYHASDVDYCQLFI